MKIEVNKQQTTNVCGHFTNIPIYSKDTPTGIANKVYKEQHRKCKACREANNQTLMTAKNKGRRRIRTVHKKESQALINELPISTIVEIVRLTNGNWWGRMRRSGYSQAEAESVSINSLISKLAREFNDFGSRNASK